MNLPPESEESLRRTATVDVALQQMLRQGNILRALQSSSYSGEESSNGQYDDGTGEWVEYLRYDVDAYNSGKGMAP